MLTRVFLITLVAVLASCEKKSQVTESKVVEPEKKAKSSNSTAVEASALVGIWYSDDERTGLVRQLELKKDGRFRNPMSRNLPEHPELVIYGGSWVYISGRIWLIYDTLFHTAERDGRLRGKFKERPSALQEWVAVGHGVFKEKQVCITNVPFDSGMLKTCYTKSN